MFTANIMNNGSLLANIFKFAEKIFMNLPDEMPETKQVRIIFPSDQNNHEILFGGKLMKWMDEVAYITALRFSKKKVVTVSVEKISFLKPILMGSIVEITGKVIKTGNVRLLISVDTYTEDFVTGFRDKAAESIFAFAAVDEMNKLVRMG